MTGELRQGRIGGLTRRSAVYGIAAVPFAANYAWALAPNTNSNVDRVIEGRVQYRVASTEEEVGYEDWRLIVQVDGSRTMESTVINNDRKSMRSMIHRVDAGFRPLECYLVYYGDGKKLGSGWFDVDGNTIYAAADTPNGRLTQMIAVPDVFSMVPHPAATDGWHFWGYDHARGGVQQHHIYNLQTDADNAGSVLGRNQTRTIELLDSGPITTPAGTFETRKWALGPLAVIWETGPDCLPVLFTYERFDREFELIEYREL